MVDRSAIDRKFNQDEDAAINSEEYYYCPLICDVLDKSDIKVLNAGMESDLNNEHKSIHAIVSDNWDDDFYFHISKLGIPKGSEICAITKVLLSDKFVSTKAETSFLLQWLLSMFKILGNKQSNSNRLYLCDDDFVLFKSKLLNFVIPIPQVWVYVIPKPPPNVNWNDWEKKHKEKPLPQRVDFLFTYNGTKHIIELDDINHFGSKKGKIWEASESNYRKTLIESRWLERCGYKVHRITNNEILERYNPSIPGSPDIDGFIELVASIGINMDQLIPL